MQINPDEITSILKSRIEGLDSGTAELTEVERRWRAGGEPTAEGPGPGEAEP